ncbi:zinc-ribbon domain-containing protein [Ligilactobacillus aviarius]|uniref:zinc-ribbon domain-containing protein n=1 Tax=Ligilactobacillus aviarius TaxID=1606 RepID=UPI00388DFA0A
MKKCPQCGFENQPHNQFCKQCGAKLTADEDQPMTREAAKEKSSKRKRKVIYLVIAIILILILVLFGIAQATGKHSSKSPASTLPKMEKRASSVAKKAPVTTAASSTAASASSGRQTAIQTMPDVNTKNLTTQQVNKWVYANIMADWNKNNTDEPPLTPADQDAFIFNQSTNDQGCVEIQVQENHQSAFMKSIHAYPESTPTIGWYRINAQGYLQQGTPGSDNWNTIAQNYQEP